jgi:Fe-S-cluster-containing hydrogenase component 2
MIQIDYDKCCWKDGQCTSCSCEGGCENSCVDICPVDAITRKEKVIIDEKCIDCGVCIDSCKHGALTHGK